VQTRRLSFVLGASFAFALAILFSVQSVAQDEQIGLPIDWSSHHLMSSSVANQHFTKIASREPRALYQWFLRNGDKKPLGTDRIAAAKERLAARSAIQVDWKFPLGTGTLPQGAYPAKFSFNVGSAALTVANCTSDYLVYGLNVNGIDTQPNLIRFNNIYAGTGGLCGAAPTVLSAYHINTLDAGNNRLNGKIRTSPVLSLTGTKIAFIETNTEPARTCPGLGSAGSCSIFHVLTWGTTGNNGSFDSVANVYHSVVPGSGVPVNNASITTLVYSSTTNTSSSPWVDYSTDRAYFGDDNGKLYSTTCVFLCAPGVNPQLATGWPITVAAAGVKMSPPVLDSGVQKIFVGGSDGNLYMVDLTKCPGASCSIAGGGLASLVAGSNTTFGGIVDGPFVDVTFHTVFAFSGNSGANRGKITQTNSTFNMGPNVSFDMGNTSLFNIFKGAVDNAYFQNTIGGATVTGTLFSCGPLGGGGQPELYILPFTKNAGVLSTANPPRMNTAANSRVNVPGNPGVGCGPLTEFLNGATDRLFFSQSALSANKCPQGSGSAADGCVMMYNITNPAAVGNQPTSAVVENAGTSAIIIDNASTSPQASSVYFANQGTASCKTGLGAANNSFCAVKLTQSALQ
jgi:hypothetical protein